MKFKIKNYQGVFGITREEPRLPFGYTYQNNNTNIVRIFSFGWFEIYLTFYKTKIFS